MRRHAHCPSLELWRLQICLHSGENALKHSSKWQSSQHLGIVSFPKFGLSSTKRSSARSWQMRGLFLEGDGLTQLNIDSFVSSLLFPLLICAPRTSRLFNIFHARSIMDALYADLNVKRFMSKCAITLLPCMGSLKTKLRAPVALPCLLLWKS